MTETDLLTPQEYAHYRRCSLRTLDRERANGVGCPYVRLGARIFYRRADIGRYIVEQIRGGDLRAVKPPPRQRVTAASTVSTNTAGGVTS
jgi:hypothetical protein